MKLIFRIAKSELRYYFYSPIAWFVMALFVFVNSGFAFEALLLTSRGQDSIMELTDQPYSGSPLASITQFVLSSSFSRTSTFLFLFVPLLTMNSINREYAFGTDKLLNSSPISISSIVAGKFVGMLLVMLSMLTLLFAVYLGIAATIENVSFPIILSSLLSLIFCIALFSSIGIFVSSLTTSPVLASIVTFVVLLVLMLIGGVFQKIDYLRELMFSLYPGQRINNIQRGLITSRDVVYFVSLSAMFLVFTIIKLKSKITPCIKWKLLLSYSLTFIIALTITSITSKHKFIKYWDVTKQQLNTADKKVQDIIGQLDGSPVKVTLYTNLLGYNMKPGLSKERSFYIWGFWDRYLRFYPNIEFEYVYYYDTVNGDSSLYHTFPGKDLEEIAIEFSKINKEAFNQFKGPSEISQLIDLSGEKKGLMMELSYKGKIARLRTYNDIEIWPADIHVAAAFQTLVTDAMPRVKYLSGHLERSPFKSGEREYALHLTELLNRNSLINYGIGTDTISNVELATFNKQDVLVIADPKTVLPDSVIKDVHNYLDAGRNAIFFTEPGKQYILNPILNHLGLNAEPGVLVRRNLHGVPVEFAGSVPDAVLDLADSYHKRKLGVGDPLKIGHHSTTFFTYETNLFRVDTLVCIKNENNDIWSERARLVVDSAKPDFEPPIDLKLTSDYLTAVRMERSLDGLSQRIIAFADGDVVSNSTQVVFDLQNGIYSYVLNGKHPAYTKTPIFSDRLLKITKGQAEVLQICLRYVLCGLILLSGTIILARRRRR